MLNKIIMTLDCLESNPLRKQMFHQDYIDLRSLIFIFIIERFFKLRYNSSSSLIVITDSNLFNFNKYFLETSDCTEESRKDETCLQLKTKKHYIKT